MHTNKKKTNSLTEKWQMACRDNYVPLFHPQEYKRPLKIWGQNVWPQMRYSSHVKLGKSLN